jgi:hypothetical protein
MYLKIPHRDLLDEITADCPKKIAHNIVWQKLANSWPQTTRQT